MTIPLALAAVACAPTDAPGGTDPIAGPCDAARLGGLVGQPFTDRLRADALRRSGARTTRVIRPGDVVTMDYRSDRLNINLTARNRVERFSCG